MAAMFALTRTPPRRIANAVRDNEERAAFVGYSTERVRLLMFVLSAFFAGIAGGLAAINYEIVTAETVSTLRSGAVSARGVHRRRRVLLRSGHRRRGLHLLPDGAVRIHQSMAALPCCSSLRS
jgi:hypothetical protein